MEEANSKKSNNKANYQRMLDKTLFEIAGDGRTPSLLLHAAGTLRSLSSRSVRSLLLRAIRFCTAV